MENRSARGYHGDGKDVGATYFDLPGVRLDQQYSSTFAPTREVADSREASVPSGR